LEFFRILNRDADPVLDISLRLPDAHRLGISNYGSNSVVVLRAVLKVTSSGTSVRPSMLKWGKARLHTLLVSYDLMRAIYREQSEP
jgi:hypothetical protein